jgi:hypothetical protein
MQRNNELQYGRWLTHYVGELDRGRIFVRFRVFILRVTSFLDRGML